MKPPGFHHFVLVTSVALVTVSFMENAALAQVRTWNTSNGNWSNPGNWLPNSVPGVANGVRIGYVPVAQDADVTLDMNSIVQSVEIENGMALRTNGHSMTALGGTFIRGVGFRSSELEVEGATYTTSSLTNEGRLRLSQGTLNVNSLLSNAANSMIFGGGIVNLLSNGDSAFINEGRISTNGSPSLVINQLGDGLIDLDGLNDTGTLSILTGILLPQGETVTINGTQLFDTFGGTIELLSGSRLNMNFTQGWTANQSSVVNLLGNQFAAGPSVIAGSDWTLEGELNVVSEQFLNLGSGDASIQADTIISDTATVRIESNNSLLFNNVNIDGGSFVVEQDADLTFGGGAVVRGGHFQTHSSTSSDGAVRFNGTTIWDGAVTIDGIALQNGTAQVTGITNIQANVFDMDGGGNSSWFLNQVATISADSIDSTISNTFDGELNLTGFLSRLNVHLTGDFDEWTMNGELNLGNISPFAAVRLGGSRMRSTGVIHTDGRVRMAAPVEFAHNGEVHFANAQSELWMESQTLVEAGATFLGDGLLRNRPTGELTLADGASLGDTRLFNEGILQVGSSLGSAAVDSFENAATGIWRIEIGGHVLGVEHDLLQVGGDAVLGGLLEVMLVDGGSGLFLPEIGDEFIILTTVEDVFGTFLADPVSFAAGHSYQWEVLYHPHDVTLRLTGIGVPEPSSALLIACGLVSIIWSRQRRIPSMHSSCALTCRSHRHFNAHSL